MAVDKMEAREIIAKRIAKELKDGDVVNLGIGIPTLVANYLPYNVSVILHSENGFLGMGPIPPAGMEDKDITNAGAVPVTILPGGSCFDSCASFIIVRGGHLDVTVLGAMEVSEQGDIANWMVPGRMVAGMGGAMDLTAGAKKVIVGMEHCAKNGSAKILQECSLPLTACKAVDLIVTEKAVLEVTEQGLLLKEIAPDLTVEDVQKCTQAALIISPDLLYMDI